MTDRFDDSAEVVLIRFPYGVAPPARRKAPLVKLISTKLEFGQEDVAEYVEYELVRSSTVTEIAAFASRPMKAVHAVYKRKIING